MNRLSRKSTEQLMELTLQQAYEMGYEDGQSSVSVEGSTVKNEGIMHEGKLLRKVNREAREGDYICPNNTKNMSRLKDGKIYGPVRKNHLNGLVAGENGYAVYENCHNRTFSTVEVFEVVTDSLPQIEKSANQQRGELIQRAKDFVDREIYERRELAGLSGDEISFKHYFYNLEFKVDAEKRVVVAFLKSVNSNRVLFKAKAKCMTGEVFHAAIGKAIALGKLFEIDIPVEFLEAVQPSHYEVGQIVQRHNESNDSNIKYQVDRIGEGETLTMLWSKGKAICDTTKPLNYEDHNYRALKVLDDTKAQYQVGE